MSILTASPEVPNVAVERTHQVSQLLLQWGQGDRAALESVLPLVYDELRRLARYHLRQARPHHTLQTTALVHEAYLRVNALDRLAQLGPQQNRIVELRYFGGLSVEEAAEFLGISPATVKRSWASARAWLLREMSGRETRA